MSKNVKQNIKKSLCSHFWTVSVIRKRHFFKTQEIQQQQRSNIMQKMEAQKVSMKTLFKKILPSKKASENPVLRRKFFQDQPPILGINSFHVETNTKNHHYFCKGNTNTFKALDLFL